MDLILSNACLRLATLLELDADNLLESSDPDELISRLQSELNLVLPVNPWSLQYSDIYNNTDNLQIESDYASRQQQYDRVSSDTDDTGLFEYTRNLVLIEITRLACFRKYESIEQANTVKTRIRDQIEHVMLNSSDGMYLFWRDWKTLLIAAIEQQQETLPHVMYIQRSLSLPALVVSYQQYGTYQAEQDIVTRNGVIHSGFCPAGRNIEVLSAWD